VSFESTGSICRNGIELPPQLFALGPPLRFSSLKRFGSPHSHRLRVGKGPRGSRLSTSSPPLWVLRFATPGGAGPLEDADAAIKRRIRFAHLDLKLKTTNTNYGACVKNLTQPIIRSS
jgi:hypothetical protein